MKDFIGIPGPSQVKRRAPGRAVKGKASRKPTTVYPTMFMNDAFQGPSPARKTRRLPQDKGAVTRRLSKRKF